MVRLTFLSVHGCPVARLGERDTGGMNVYLLQLAKELGRQGHKVDVYTRYHDPEDPQVMELGENARVIHLKAGPYFDKKESLHRYVPEFLSSLYEFQAQHSLEYDVVHSHYWLSGSAAMELCRRWDVPHVATFHTTAKVKMDARPGESESALRVNSETDVMESADAIVVSTQQEKSDLSRLYGVFADKIRVVPAGVDLGLFQPMSQPEARRTLGITEDRVVLAVGARIQPLKGFDLLIEAIGRVKDAADTRLLIVGGRPELDAERDKLRSLAAREGLDGTVSLVGPVSQDKLPTYYGAADVFVLPSYYETFGMSALEAMACGVPVISSAAGGVKSYLQDGETGYLVPWQSAESYAHALDGLLADAALRHRMSLAARAKAETMDWGKVVSRLLAIYAGLEERALTSVAGA